MTILENDAVALSEGNSHGGVVGAFRLALKMRIIFWSRTTSLALKS